MERFGSYWYILMHLEHPHPMRYFLCPRIPFFALETNLGHFCGILFAPVEGDRCDQMYDIPPDIVKIAISSTQVIVLEYHSKSLTSHISYVVYFTLRVLCCCIPGCRPTDTHMDIVLNVDVTYLKKVVSTIEPLQHGFPG
jgi:hypothetical protein